MSKFYLSIGMCAVIFIAGCGGSFAIIDDSVSTSPKYRKTRMQAGVLNEQNFEEFKTLGRRSVAEDETLSATNKKRKLESLEALTYQPHQSLFFTMVFNTPFTDEELNLKFKVLNSKKKNIYAGYSLIPITIYEINQYGTTVSYNYTFIIHLSKPLISASDASSTKLSIRFPDKCERIYEVKI